MINTLMGGLIKFCTEKMVVASGYLAHLLFAVARCNNFILAVISANVRDRYRYIFSEILTK